MNKIEDPSIKAFWGLEPIKQQKKSINDGVSPI